MRVLASGEPPAASAQTTAPTTETRAYRPDATLRLLPRTDTPVDPERRDHLERDLDRVQQSLNSERTAFGQQLNWLMLSQALLLNAYLLVLIFGWSTPLPAKRWLLAGIAVFAAVVAVLIVMALRGTRGAVMALHQQRKLLEATLQREFGREPVFAPRGMVTRGMASFANGLLPLTFVAGWIALTLYTLAAPLGSQTTAAAQAGATVAASPRHGGFRW